MPLSTRVRRWKIENRSTRDTLLPTFCVPAGRAPRRVGLLLDKAHFRACRAHTVHVTGCVGDVAAADVLDEALRGARENIPRLLRLAFGRRRSVRNCSQYTSALIDPGTRGLWSMS